VWRIADFRHKSAIRLLPKRAVNGGSGFCAMEIALLIVRLA
jgi:hypothetical protein